MRNRAVAFSGFGVTMRGLGEVTVFCLLVSLSKGFRAAREICCL